jgi:hypothetical protein
MLKSPCLFVALESFWPTANPFRAPVKLPSLVHHMVADHRAMGYAIVPLGEARHFSAITDRDRLLLQTDVEVAIAVRGGVPIRTVLLMDEPRDPTEIWQVARQFDLELGHSVLLSLHGHHAGVCRTAGIQRLLTEADLQRTLALA